MKVTLQKAPEILRTRKLTVLDAHMSRDVYVRFCGTEFLVPIAQIDAQLQGTKDNPTFGNVREIYARDCYLAGMKLNKPIGAILDAGANRGMFSLLALVHLGASIVVGVEPVQKYVEINKLLMESNQFPIERAPRYTRFLAKPSVETTNPSENISILSIMKEQGIDRFGFVKMDIEGFEKSVFEEPEWLEYVDNIAMELHPQFVGDLSIIGEALTKYGLKYRTVDQNGNEVPINQAMFLQASRTGALN